MADRFPSDFPSTSDAVHLRPRKGHDMAWACDKHGEPISFHCKEHLVPICHKCATKDHQKPCTLEDIEDVVFEMRRKLDDKVPELEEMMQRLKNLSSEIQSRSDFMSNLLETLRDEINLAYEDKVKGAEEKERAEIHLINEEADEEIRIINEKREKRLQACRSVEEKKQQIMKGTHSSLISDIETIDTKVVKKTQELKSENHCKSDMTNNISSRIKRIKQEDKALLEEAPQVISSIDERVGAILHEEKAILDCLDHLKGEVQRVKFVEGTVGGEDYARIGGYVGKWELVKTIDIPFIIRFPYAFGFITDEEICVKNQKGLSLYVTNISTGITCSTEIDCEISGPTSCAPVDRSFIICGMSTHITLCDRQYREVRMMEIPRSETSSNKNHRLFAGVFVDVDSDGMIIASQVGQSNIYVINPADGKILSTITIQDKITSDSIQALSTGDIVVQTDNNEFIVISRSGEMKAHIKCDEWDRARCNVDKLTDTLYVTYWDARRKVRAVDQVSPNGVIQARSIFGTNVSYRYGGPCLISPSGKFIACDGERFFVYNKVFDV